MWVNWMLCILNFKKIRSDLRGLVWPQAEGRGPCKDESKNNLLKYSRSNKWNETQMNKIKWIRTNRIISRVIRVVNGRCMRGCWKVQTCFNVNKTQVHIRMGVLCPVARLRLRRKCDMCSKHDLNGTRTPQVSQVGADMAPSKGSQHLKPRSLNIC